MPIHTLEPHLVDSLQQSAREILETMVMLSPRSIEAVPEEKSSFRDAVIGLMGFTGTRSGTFVVRTSEPLARTIAAKMLMLEPADLPSFAEAADAFGEVVNMLGGNFKNAWVASGNQMDLSVPTVIHNGSVNVRSQAAGCLRSCIHVQVDGGALDIGVHFEARD
jgi:CheY-specific phosphatase CheX